MRRHTIYFLLGIALFFSLSGARADSISISRFEGKGQEMSNWCWAASIQSIFLTKGLQVAQSDIVAAAYGRDANGIPPNKTAPGFGGTLSILNGLSVGADGKLWKIKAAAGESFPNANWLFSELSANKPVMIWYKDEQTNHSIVVNGGEYLRDAFGNIQWVLLTAYDPWFDRIMTINAANIPQYVYGTFKIELKRLATRKKKSSEAPIGSEEADDRSDCPKESTPHGYIREHCKGITKIVR